MLSVNQNLFRRGGSIQEAARRGNESSINLVSICIDLPQHAHKKHNMPYTVEPGNSKLFEKQQTVYYCQEFTIEKVIYVINWLKSSQKKFTIDPLFTIDRFTIARFDCTMKRSYNLHSTILVRNTYRLAFHLETPCLQNFNYFAWRHFRNTFILTMIESHTGSSHQHFCPTHGLSSSMQALIKTFSVIC